MLKIHIDEINEHPERTSELGSSAISRVYEGEYSYPFSAWEGVMLNMSEILMTTWRNTRNGGKLQAASHDDDLPVNMRNVRVGRRYVINDCPMEAAGYRVTEWLMGSMGRSGRC